MKINSTVSHRIAQEIRNEQTTVNTCVLYTNLGLNVLTEDLCHLWNYTVCSKMQQNVLMISKVSVLNKKDKESLSCHRSKPLLISQKMDSVIVKVDFYKSTPYLSETIQKRKKIGL